MNAMLYLPGPNFQAAGDLLHRWRADTPTAGVMALVAEADRDAVPLLQTYCQDLGLPLAGAIFPALLEGEEFRDRGVWLLRFDEMPYRLLEADIPTSGEALEETMDRLAGQVRQYLNGGHQEADGADTTLLLIFDALLPHIGTLLDEFYLRLANRVGYMGVNAGSESFQPMPCLFDESRLVARGVLALVLRPHGGAILEHGYQVPEQMITATSTRGNRIIQIDWRPAFEVYQELAREQYGVEIDRDNFYQYAVHFPVGIVRANGITLVRIPVALEEDGSLFCIGEVAPNSVLALLKAPVVDTGYTLDKLVRGLTATHGRLDGRDLLLFYCAGRRLHLGANAPAEVRALAERARVRRIVGAVSLGEIGSAVEHEYPLFHNATLVATLWGPPRR